jgi:hypothetical protein
MMQNKANLLPADRQGARGGKVALPAPPGPSVQNEPNLVGSNVRNEPNLRRPGDRDDPSFHYSILPGPQSPAAGPRRIVRNKANLAEESQV